MIPLGDFAVKYGARAADLGVPIDDLYQALVDTAENTVRLCFRFSVFAFAVGGAD
jgi:hypothetical protein